MDAREMIRTIGRSDVSAEERLAALGKIKRLIDTGEIVRAKEGDYVNNHIHTIYSFSPYTPASALFYAWKAGLRTAGIMDHDSVGGMREFIRAGEILGMPTTCGFECRVSVEGTPLTGRKINNPDQCSVAYLAMHGVPARSIDMAEVALAPLREKRNLRNRRMCERITELVEPFGMELDFDADVYPLSMAAEGGSVTERHICYALVKKIVGKYPDRGAACDFVSLLCGGMAEKVRAKLMNAPEEFYEYDILGVLKSSLVERFYVPAEEECMNIRDFTALARKLGAISAYAYLGDVGESPTGDKKAQKFEDDYLPLLFETLSDCGFDAVTYMPSRNTPAQLERVMELCGERGLFQISGEDINSPRQSFICEALELYPHLSKATYALIGHERAEDGMFAVRTMEKLPDLGDRIELYAGLGGMK